MSPSSADPGSASNLENDATSARRSWAGRAWAGRAWGVRRPPPRAPPSSSSYVPAEGIEGYGDHVPERVWDAVRALGTAARGRARVVAHRALRVILDWASRSGRVFYRCVVEGLKGFARNVVVGVATGRRLEDVVEEVEGEMMFTFVGGCTAFVRVVVRYLSRQYARMPPGVAAEMAQAVFDGLRLTRAMVDGLREEA